MPGNLDAAVTWGVKGDSFFFKGNRYWKFSNRVLVSGYPKNISEWNGLPSNLDAALEWFDNEHLYFFKGAKYWKYSMVEKRVKPKYPKKITNHGQKFQIRLMLPFNGSTTRSTSLSQASTGELMMQLFHLKRTDLPILVMLVDGGSDAKTYI